jgi:ADP-ribose pyrophosphatase YjhB (NUDIX family)
MPTSSPDNRLVRYAPTDDGSDRVVTGGSASDESPTVRPPTFQPPTVQPTPDGRDVRPPLPEHEFAEIFGKVPRLTVELVLRGPDGVLLTQRRQGPCAGLWHLPGGTVRFAEPVVAAVARVAADELGVAVEVGPLLGYIEYPSHYLRGLDSPVGLAFLCTTADDPVGTGGPGRRWWTTPPEPMHAEQVAFLVGHRLLAIDR